eukprot:gnl/Chilomastix_cuspidata/2561.p1 GENE.gnl/Chilomastix_cuspidata/2561~~gnl/Chilomastix_cuspidata/2561.p1  ORF type:complete len:364 (-),score=139.01 gnl/Chilomastix_cuspidata/2561:216-1307(-)
MSATDTTIIPLRPNTLCHYIKRLLALLGIRAFHHKELAAKISKGIFKTLMPPESKVSKPTHTAEVSFEQLILLIHKILNKERYMFCSKKYIAGSWGVVSGGGSVIVLFSGTSGVGKSTLASIFANKIGVSNILSTDTLRHTLRTCSTREENPVLFASTYECGALAPAADAATAAMPASVRGYRAQCAQVMPWVRRFVLESARRRQSIVIEGVHLLPELCADLARAVPAHTVFVCAVVQTEPEKHLEHLRWRGSQAVECTANKYVDSFDNIVEIQAHLVAEAARHRIPVITNKSTDQSIAHLQASLRYHLQSYAKSRRPGKMEVIALGDKYARKCLHNSKLYLPDGRTRAGSLTARSGSILGIP